MILFFDFHQSSVKSNNLKDMILFYDFISRRFHHISRNHDLWYFNPRCLGKQDIGSFCCSSLVIRDYTWRFAPYSLAHFKNQLFFILLSKQMERSTGDELEFISQHMLEILVILFFYYFL